MRHVLAVILLFVIGSVQAATVSIDFEELPLGGTAGLSVSSQGFSFSSEEVFFVTDITDKALSYCPSCSVTMGNESGQLFDLYSFDLATLSGPADVTVTGFYGGGGTVSTIIAVGDTADTYLFDASWSQLSQLVIGTPTGPSPPYAGSLYNVTVNTVPIPAAVWLFGSGLGLLGWFRRRAS